MAWIAKRDFLAVLVRDAVGKLCDDEVDGGAVGAQGDHGGVPRAGAISDGLVRGGDEGLDLGQVGRVLDSGGGGGLGSLLLLLGGRHDDEIGTGAVAPRW